MAKPTIAHGRPMPATIRPPRTAGTLGSSIGSSPSPNSAVPIPARRTSPNLRSARPHARPPMTAPIPCTVTSTPKNAGGLCRPYCSTANANVSPKPMTSMATDTVSTIRRSVPRASTWRTPAVSSRITWCSRCASAVSRACSRARHRAETRKVPASSTATDPPPMPVKRAAPRSGANRRVPSLKVCSSALASPRRSAGSSTVRNADWAAEKIAEPAP